MFQYLGVMDYWTSENTRGAHWATYFSSYKCLPQVWWTLYFTYWCVTERTWCHLVSTSINREVRCDCLRVKGIHVCRKELLYALWQARVFSVEVKCDRAVPGLSLLCPVFWCIHDYNPLQYIFTAPKLDATRRWVSLPADFNFKAHCKPGRQNSDADGYAFRNITLYSTVYRGCSQDMLTQH